MEKRRLLLRIASKRRLLLLLGLLFFQVVAFHIFNYRNLQILDGEQQMQTIDKRASWCPRATCHETAVCNTCQRRFLVIIAQGRSASTTLMQMLDLLPNVRMGGENIGLVGEFFRMMDVLKTGEFKLDKQLDSGAYKHNQVQAGGVTCAGQAVFEAMYPPRHKKATRKDDEHTILGFKTILYNGVSAYQKLFPCARFLVNIRSNSTAVLNSRLRWFSNYSSSLTRVKDEEISLRKAAELLGESAVLLDSTVWTKDVSVFNDAIAWLGFHESCNFTSLLEFNTRRGYIPTKSRMVIDSRCRYVGRLH